MTALALVMMLGLGALFLSFSAEYAPEVYSLLFGEVLGIASNEIAPTAVLGVVCILAVGDPLPPPDAFLRLARGRGGARSGQLPHGDVLPRGGCPGDDDDGAGGWHALDLQPDDRRARRRPVVHRPAAAAMALSVAIALLIVWAAIAASYATDYPVGFFVGTASAASYALGRGWASWRGRRGFSGEAS